MDIGVDGHRVDFGAAGRLGDFDKTRPDRFGIRAVVAGKTHQKPSLSVQLFACVFFSICLSSPPLFFFFFLFFPPPPPTNKKKKKKKKKHPPPLFSQKKKSRS